MGLFKKRKKEIIDERTDLEVSFEEKGQKIGKGTGEFVQKSINKINELKENMILTIKLKKSEDLLEELNKKLN
jgi:hypothetical protein